MQLTLDTEQTANLRARILDVLRDGRWHSGAEFLNGAHGFYCSSYSQRIGQSRRAGHDIEATGRGGHELASYRLRREAA